MIDDHDERARKALLSEADRATAILAEAEQHIDDALARLQAEVAALAIFLPDLPDRHKRLIDDAIELIDRWGGS